MQRLRHSDCFSALRNIRRTLCFPRKPERENMGMAAANVIVGWLNDRAHAGADNPSGYLPMLWFFGIVSLVGTLIGAWLWLRPSAPARRVEI